MIMKRVLLLLVCALSVGLFHSCSEDLGESGIEIPEFNLKDLTPTDLYIYKKLYETLQCRSDLSLER